jgi:3-oxoadipate enol-lactonase
VNRAEIGRREFSRATAGKGPVATGRVREASPVLAAGVEQFIFADVFSRSGLPARERELLTVAVLAAIGGADNQLGVHVPAALECGADPVRTILDERGLPLPLPVIEVGLADHDTLVAEVGEGADGTLFLHAPELDRRMWRDLMRELPDGHHAVAPDLRGAGAAVGAPAPAGVADLVADLLGVLDDRGLARVEVVVQGASAALACALADAHADRITRITFVGPRPVETGPVPGADVLARQLRAVTLAADTWAARYARDRFARLDHEGWAVRAGVLVDVALARTRGVDCRVVVGDADTWAEPGLVGQVWPDASVTTVSAAGHLVPLEAPLGLAAAIIAVS